jgi:RNA polymerase sigma factor (sigma-70 family)
MLTATPEALDGRSSRSYMPDEPDDELRRALMTLPRQQRTIVVLRHCEDLSEAAVADLLGCSVGTVKNQNFRAMKRLRALLSLNETHEVNR